MKLHNKILLFLILLFLILLGNNSFAFTGKDYLNNDISFTDIPSSIDISNGFLYIKTDNWGEELKVLDAGSYYYRSGSYLYLSGTGVQYNLKNNTWSCSSTLSNGSDIRLTATGFRMYSSVSIYIDKDKTGYFYKVSVDDEPEQVTTYPKYDFSMDGVFSWLNKQIESLAGCSREELEQNSEFMAKVEQYRDEQRANEESLLDKIGHILDYINPTSEKFFLWGITDLLINLIDTIVGFIDGLFNFLWNLIVDVVKFLFVPSEERFTAISDTVTSKFGFIDTIKNAVEEFKRAFDSVEDKPALSIDVDSRYYTGSLVSIDLSWYTQFKPFVDTVITGFCYLFFLWRLYISIPNIVNGVGTGMTYIDKIRGIDDK